MPCRAARSPGCTAAPAHAVRARPPSVNLNTAPREVIAALFDGMNLASAET
ncbi:MAG: hypothetical protein EOP39_20150, partial [Rubrivivax sp.]